MNKTKGSELDLALSNICNQFLVHIRNKLSLLFQLLTYLEIGDNRQRCLKYANQYKQFKKTQFEICERFQRFRLITLNQKQIFDRFCLNLYESFETYIINLKSNKTPRFDTNTLLPKIQILFQKFENSVTQLNIQNFLYDIIECQQHFTGLYLRRVAHERRDLNQLINQCFQEILKTFVQPKIQQNNHQLFLKAQHQIFSIKNKTKTAYEYVRPIRKKQFTEKKNGCNYCQAINIMEIVNLSEVFHPNPKKSQNMMMSQLYRINQQIKKQIIGFIKSHNKQIKSKCENTKTDHTSPNQKKLFTFMRNRNSDNQNNFTMEVTYGRSAFSKFGTITDFSKMWSNQKRRDRKVKRGQEYPKISCFNRTLFPKLV